MYVLFMSVRICLCACVHIIARRLLDCEKGKTCAAVGVCCVCCACVCV